MSGVITAIGVAASVASAAYTITRGAPKAASAAAAPAPVVNAAPAQDEVNKAATNAATLRSQLLETAGGSAGDPLQPGDTSRQNTIFAN